MSLLEGRNERAENIVLDLFNLWDRVEEIKKEAMEIELQDPDCFNPEVRREWETFFQHLQKAQDSIL